MKSLAQQPRLPRRASANVHSLLLLPRGCGSPTPTKPRKVDSSPCKVEQRVSWAESFTVPGQNPENEKIQLTTKFLRRERQQKCGTYGGGAASGAWVSLIKKCQPLVGQMFCWPFGRPTLPWWHGMKLCRPKDQAAFCCWLNEIILRCSHTVSNSGRLNVDGSQNHWEWSVSSKKK